MKWIGKVILFFINAIWWINALLNVPLKTVVSVISAVTAFSALFGSGSGWTALGWFLLLTFIMAFPALYQPKGFDKRQ